MAIFLMKIREWIKIEGRGGGIFQTIFLDWRRTTFPLKRRELSIYKNDFLDIIAYLLFNFLLNFLRINLKDLSC